MVTGHQDLTVTPSGFHISTTHSFLGATTDGCVYNPHNTDEPFGFLEVKCPFSSKDIEPAEACKNPRFFCAVNQTTKLIELKEDHSYFPRYKAKWPLEIELGVILLFIHRKASACNEYSLMNNFGSTNFCLSWNHFTITACFQN